MELRRQGTKSLLIGTPAIARDGFADSFAQEPESRRDPGFFTDGLYAVSPWIVDSANAETLALAARFRARFGDDLLWQAAQGYDSARLAIAAALAAAAAPAQDDRGHGGTIAPAAFHNLTQWEALSSFQRRDILVTESALGNPRLVGVAGIRELSGYRLEVELARRTLPAITKTLLPLFIMGHAIRLPLFGTCGMSPLKGESSHRNKSFACWIKPKATLKG